MQNFVFSSLSDREEHCVFAFSARDNGPYSTEFKHIPLTTHSSCFLSPAPYIDTRCIHASLFILVFFLFIIRLGSIFNSIFYNIFQLIAYRISFSPPRCMFLDENVISQQQRWNNYTDTIKEYSLFLSLLYNWRFHKRDVY